MTLRTYAAANILRVRRLINDPLSADSVFTDLEVQDALDRHSVQVRYEGLTAVETYGSDGTVSYLEYVSIYKDWESGVVLQDGDWDTLTPATSDLAGGQWTFSTSQDPPVYATGTSHDPYAAAVDLLEEWAAKMALQFSFSADGASYQLAQKRDGLMGMADRYRQRMRSRMVVVKREDLT